MCNKQLLLFSVAKQMYIALHVEGCRILHNVSMVLVEGS